MKGSSALALLIGAVVLLALVGTSSTEAGSSPARLRLHQAASLSAAVPPGPLDPLSVAEIIETFKVIESIIGGCPLNYTYNFTVPDFAPSSDTALLSWSWFNLIGSREM